MMPFDSHDRHSCSRVVAKWFGWLVMWCVIPGSSAARAQVATIPTLAASRNVPSLQVAEDLEVDLLLQEPVVANPVYLNFDERGRLWVVEYRQYPWPAGLKLVSRDNVWRNVYDPPFAPPPPHATDSPFRGRDVISIHEDTDGDGDYDLHKKFLEGLNLATAALKGRDGVFVMNPPYLLFYADRNNDDLPDSLAPRILLSGFGIEDTHSIANSLRWGPDGWIYGTEGSTVSASVVRHGDDGKPVADEAPIHSMGQNVWRYHPELHKYEIFAEGGGNAFGVEFDSLGRVYSGHNGGDTRGFHYVPGGYYLKNFGKHGLHSNPFVFGHYGSMKHHPVERFTHTFEIYEADGLPQHYQNKLFAVSPILHYVMASEISADGSSLKTTDIGPVVSPNTGQRDNWFTPVDIQTGPDGSLYVADWYSVQASHYKSHEGQTNPDLGRVYRLRNAQWAAQTPIDLSTCPSIELVQSYLTHPNRWYRETALRLLGDRKDTSVVPKLRELIADPNQTHAQNYLWALNLCGRLSESDIKSLLRHRDATVRTWTVRLAIEQGLISDEIARQLVTLAREEPDVSVRLQLACSCRKLSTARALAVLGELLKHGGDSEDVFLPNAIWWAVESHADHRQEVLRWLEPSDAWHSSLSIAAKLGENLMRRYATLGKSEDLLACARLLQQSPDPTQTNRLLAGFTQAFEGRSIPDLPTELVAELARIEGRFAIVLGIRRGDLAAIATAYEKIRDRANPEDVRVQYICALGEVQAAIHESVPLFLQQLEEGGSETLLKTCLDALQRFDSPEIGTSILARYSTMPPSVQETAQSVLASRPAWAIELIEAVERGEIPGPTVNQDTIARLRWHRDSALQAAVTKHFPAVEPDALELDQRIELVEQIALNGNGSPLEGQKLFHDSATCGKCHQLFGRGGQVGPDLTSYNRSNLRLMLLAIINPSAEIREGYENLTVLTLDGRVVTGFKLEENDQSLVLCTADGQRQAIDKQLIDEQSPNRTSLMPTGLLDGLSENQLRDLCAFLTSTTPPN